MIGYDEINFPHELLLTDRQIESLSKAFANTLSAKIKFSQAQLPKLTQTGEYLGGLLGPFMIVGLPFRKNALQPFSQDMLIPLRLTAASAADAIHKNILRSGTFGSGTTTLITWNEEMDDLMKIVKDIINLYNCLLKNANFLIKATKQWNKSKQQWLNNIIYH